jgi:polyisoprenoid-binding protein YceI
MNQFLKFSLLCLALVSSASYAQQKLVPAQSQVSFVSKQMGVPVDGNFTKFDAQMSFDPKKPETSKINFTLDLNSVVIGDASTIAEVKKAGWFDTLKFPSASFVSSSIKALGAGKFEVAGALSIKGKSQPIVVPITLTQQGPTTNANGSFTIKRLDFKIGDGEWNDVSLVANEVIVKLKLAMTGLGPL